MVSEALKNLGQVKPAVATLTTLYAVPAAKSAVASTLLICNQGSVVATFRISHAIGAAGDTLSQYLYYDQQLLPNKSFAVTLGLALAATDVIRVYSSNGQMSFNLYGAEIT